MRPAVVVHVLPVDLSRGAQTYARALRDRLDGDPDTHRTLTLFAGPTGPLDADERLGVSDGAMRRAGLHPLALQRLRTALDQLGADVVVAHGGESLKYAALAAKKRPLVYYKIGTAVGMGSSPRHRLYRWLMGRTAITAAVSEETAQEAITDFGLAPERVRVIVNGRDPGRYAPGPPRPTSATTQLMFVGQLTDSKRPLRFVEIVRRLVDEGLDVTASVVGDGPLRAEVADVAAALPVEVLGRRDDVHELLARADVLVFTSRPEGEGMPGVMIEGGLAGIPVVATDVAGSRTVIDDGHTGRVVAVEDFEALVGAVRDLVRDPAGRARMGAAARERCLDKFTLDASAREWQRVIDGLLDRSTQ